MTDDRVLRIDRFPTGVITPPPSKSLSHRALICAALAGGVHAIDRIENMGDSDDISATRSGILNVLAGLCNRPVDCGESGSTLRFLIPIAAVFSDAWVFKGKGRLFERPLSVYSEVFAAHGVAFANTGDEVHVRGPLRAGIFEVRGDISSQFISGLLLALPLLDGDSEIRLLTPLESAGYVDLTLDVMHTYGVSVERRFSVKDHALTGFAVPGGQKYRETPFRIEPDYSQAAFFLGAGALGCEVAVAGLNPNSLQGDRRILDVLREMGAVIGGGDKSPHGFAQIRIQAPDEGLHGITIDVSDIPDLVPPIAALAAVSRGVTRIENAYRLRMKESDRLHALKEALGALGAEIIEEKDALVIVGKKTLSGGRTDAWKDHRIAMAVALAAIKCARTVEITGSGAVRKSYPAFWKDWSQR
ncbi:MAG: 3-phosphoshikimate 1-carboxyvinyltransferase [Clostridiales Family XIII bacterium]|jgi:3-phosphoshikimate 1-carboxyvinyltransferase|nr:3-phosphoshikimate 1-carboxyvinyltransferase [Clostridiales Family XIII bacterium]